MLSPRLSNIHIFGLNGSVSPVAGLTASLDLFYYTQDQALATSASDGTFNNGGYMIATAGEHRDLGTEIDLVLHYVWTDYMRVEVYAARFMRGDAYDGQPGSDSVDELRAEVVVRF